MQCCLVLTQHLLLGVLQFARRAGHRRLQEAPSAKFLMHTNSMQSSTPVFADGTEGQNKLFQGV